jgi:hypothetical protein
MSLAITQRGLLDALSSKARQSNESNQDCKSQINTRTWSRLLILHAPEYHPDLAKTQRKRRRTSQFQRVRNASRFTSSLRPHLVSVPPDSVLTRVSLGQLTVYK